MAFAKPGIGGVYFTPTHQILQDVFADDWYSPFMAKKVIILVRHGQYHKATENAPERLTALGRKQAALVAKRLKEYEINRIVHSTMPRAAETANIIRDKLGFRKKLQSCDSLRECVPGFPPKLRKKFGHSTEKLQKYQRQAERAFKKHFRGARQDSVELLVCHGNIIRYLVCKTLGVDTLGWTSMDIQQCGISIIEIRTSGPHKKMVLSHNDVGHIPKRHRTFI